ncbi:MAG: MBL fold metallo-hydrolase [Pseudomonadales bacterium]|nr:MBL fold metallo-hydrolase [Pseudomonadales bacterium]
MNIGDIQIERILEMETPFLPPMTAFPDAPPAAIEQHRHWLEPNALCPASGKLIIAIQTYVIRTRHHLILVDTCLGCDKTNTFFPEWHQRSDRAWYQKLLAKGIHPEQVDYVFCTHLHGDHCGWNTQLVDGRWVPTFPNATYIIAKQEIEHVAAAGTPAYQESVLPVMEAGQVLPVATDFALDDQVWLQATPGHTPGHVAVHLQSGAQRAVLCGDLIHSPLQCLYPHWAYWIDSDPKQAIATRTQFLQTQCEHQTLVMTAHFPSPSIGYVQAHGEAFKFQFRDF